MRTTITPSKAKWLLEGNTINRKPKDASVIFLAREIEAGRWVYNGESIIIANDGTLLDGQHRLLACVMANKAIDVELVEGISIGVMPTIDTGVARGSKDVFTIEGIPNANTVSSGVKAILDGVTTKKRHEGSKNIKISNTELLEFYKDKKDILDVLAKFSTHLYNTGAKIMPPAQILSCIYLLQNESSDDNIYKFFRELITGVNLGGANTAQTLRTKLINDKISKSTISITNKIYYVIKAFRLYNQDQDRNSIRIMNGEKISFNDIDFSKAPSLNIDYMMNHS